MKRRLRLSSGLMLVLALAACSGLRVSHDYDTEYDFSRVRSYAWAEHAQPKTGDPLQDNPLRDAELRRAIDRVLAERGLRPDDPPDLLVKYRFRVETRTRTSTVSVYGGFGSWGRHGGVSIGVGGPVSTTRYPYQQGTLIIDLLDARDGRLVWRGTGSAELGGERSPEARRAALFEAVRAILAAFPPKRSGEAGP